MSPVYVPKEKDRLCLYVAFCLLVDNVIVGGEVVLKVTLDLSMVGIDEGSLAVLAETIGEYPDQPTALYALKRK
jgi:hypothetical protein